MLTLLSVPAPAATPAPAVASPISSSAPPETLLFASALAENGVPFELHVYPHGYHGLSLANGLVNGPDGVLPNVQTWVKFATEWVYNL